MKPLGQQVPSKQCGCLNSKTNSSTTSCYQMLSLSHSVFVSSPRKPGRYHMLKANVLVPSAPSATTCTCTVFLGVNSSKLYANKFSVRTTQRLHQYECPLLRMCFFPKQGLVDIKPRHLCQNSRLVSTSCCEFLHILPPLSSSLLPLVWCSPNSPFCFFVFSQESSQQQHCCSQRFPGSPGFPELPGTQHASSQFSFSIQASVQISRGERERGRKEKQKLYLNNTYILYQLIPCIRTAIGFVGMLHKLHLHSSFFSFLGIFLKWPEGWKLINVMSAPHQVSIPSMPPALVLGHSLPLG